MIAAALRYEIDAYAARMRTGNPLFRLAAEGLFTREMMVCYLSNVHELVRHTPIHLVRAKARARATDQRALAEHYARKLGEEVGHDAWARDDLTHFEQPAPAPSPTAGPAMQSWLGFIERIIDEDPTLYLGYILFAEYLIVLLGPEWLALLESRCGISRSAMTVIGNHIELDQGHVDHAMDEIDALVGDPRKLARMREVVRETLGVFDVFCAEVCATPTAAATVSAA
jgi:hypothetical protein